MYPTTRVQSCFLEMNLLVICISLIFFLSMNGQKIQYACRFRNFSVESETNSGYLVKFDLYQENYDHKISAMLNLTKDIHIKSIDVIVDRCSFEKYECEYFIKWKFTKNLKAMAYMKNQIWTPFVEKITPRPDAPFLKKNVYQNKDANCDAEAALRFYPEVLNYFWRMDTILNDQNDRKALVMNVDSAIISYVKRDKPRDRGRTRTTKPKPQ